MKKFILLVTLFLILLSGCSSLSKNLIFLEFTESTRQLNVSLISSACYLTKIKTQTKNDTLILFIYEKPFFFSFKEDKKKVSGVIEVDSCFHYIQHGAGVYTLSDLPEPGGETTSIL